MAQLEQGDFDASAITKCWFCCEEIGAGFVITTDSRAGYASLV
jgi:hypothetical protein